MDLDCLLLLFSCGKTIRSAGLHKLGGAALHDNRICFHHNPKGKGSMQNVVQFTNYSARPKIALENFDEIRQVYLVPQDTGAPQLRQRKPP